MSLEITGKLIEKLPMQSGTSNSTGRSWQKQQFVIETVEQYPRKICAMLWGDKADQLNMFNPGDMLKVSFDVESREYQGRWYTDVKAWKVEAATAGAAQGVPEPMAYNPAGAAPHTSYTPPAPSFPTADPAGLPEDTFSDEGMTDDLPF